MHPSNISLLGVFLIFGASFASPAKKSSDEALLDQSNPSMFENEVQTKNIPVVRTPLEETEEIKLKSDSLSPVDNPPSVIHSENEPTFGTISGFGEGSVLNVEYGYAGKGQATGIAGGVVNEKGLSGGGAGFAAGVAGVDTESLKGYFGVNAHQQASFNTYGEKPESFKYEKDSEDAKADASVEGPTKVNDLESKAPEPILHHLVTVPLHVIGALLKPILPLAIATPGLFKPLGGLHLARPASSETKENSAFGVAAERSPAEVPTAAAGAATATKDEEQVVESGFYTFFRPITPTGISESISTIFKPLSTLSGQAQGSITLTGGASYTGTPPKEEHVQHHGKPVQHVEKPTYVDEKPSYVDEKPTHVNNKPNCQDNSVDMSSEKPNCHNEKPTCHNENQEHSNVVIPEEKIKECKILCRKNGKNGGTLHKGCCMCSCPVPLIPPGHPCCSGPSDACQTLCQENSFYNYTGGSCDAKRICECQCNPWEPVWELSNGGGA